MSETEINFDTRIEVSFAIKIPSLCKNRKGVYFLFCDPLGVWKEIGVCKKGKRDK